MLGKRGAVTANHNYSFEALFKDSFYSIAKPFSKRLTLLLIGIDDKRRKARLADKGFAAMDKLIGNLQVSLKRLVASKVFGAVFFFTRSGKEQYGNT